MSGIAYLPDPGGIFRSDVHRRVAAHLPLPDEDPKSAEAMLERLHDDASTPLVLDGEGDLGELEGVLASLVADEWAEQGKEGFRLTAGGLDKLTGPVANEPPPLKGPRLAAAEALDAELTEEEEAGEQRAKEEAVQRAKDQLAEAEAALEEG